MWGSAATPPSTNQLDGGCGARFTAPAPVALITIPGQIGNTNVAVTFPGWTPGEVNAWGCAWSFVGGSSAFAAGGELYITGMEAATAAGATGLDVAGGLFLAGTGLGWSLSASVSSGGLLVNCLVVGGVA
jgi:hypothetical protein